MKKEIINVSWWVTRSAHSIAAIVFMLGIVASAVLALLYGFSKLDPDYITPDMASDMLSWLIISGIAAATALVIYLVISPFITPLRVLSRKDIIDLEKVFPGCAYAEVLRFYTDVGTINQLTVNRIRRSNEENDLETLRQRYLGSENNEGSVSAGEQSTAA